MMLTHVSLCTGIGGMDLAIEAALGATTILQVEYDKACQEVLEKHWPDTKRLGDLTTIDWATALEGVMPDDSHGVDILSAGYP